VAAEVASTEEAEAFMVEEADFMEADSMGAAAASMAGVVFAVAVAFGVEAGFAAEDSGAVLPVAGFAPA
jgi:hypothetical protein